MGFACASSRSFRNDVRDGAQHKRRVKIPILLCFRAGGMRIVEFERGHRGTSCESKVTISLFKLCPLRRLEPPPVSASYIPPCSPTTTTTTLFAANHLCVTPMLLLGLNPASGVTISLNKMPRIAKDTNLINPGLFVRGTSSLVCSTCSWCSQVSCVRLTLYQLRGVFGFIFPKYRL